MSLSASLFGFAACGSSEDDVSKNEESASLDDDEDEDEQDAEDEQPSEDEDEGSRPSGTLDGGNRRDGGGNPGRDAGGPRADDAGAGPTTDASATKDGGKGDGPSASEKDASSGSDAGPATAASGDNTCGLPDIADYAAKGPYDAKMFPGVGPDANYTLFRPDTMLGKDGIKHPIAVWGNGISTIPEWYQHLLGFFASHGFVVVACNDSVPERPCLNTGIEWLIEQNTAAGDLQGKLDTSQEATIGYSWGGGAAIDTANRPNVKATVSFHGMPPRGTTAFQDMHSPLLLFTSTGDTFVTPAGYVTPNYEKSMVPTFYATLDEPVDHGYPIDDNGTVCDVASLLVGGPCKGAEKHQAPALAWLRYYMCGDENAGKYFFGPSCELCSSPWNSQSKPAGMFM